MLKRIIFILVLAMVLPVAKPVFANPIADSAVSQLRDQGYSDIQVRRTLLGRIRITAASDTYTRELVIHPITGEIMRDRWSSKKQTRETPKPISIDPEGNDGGDNADEGGDSEGDGGDGEGDGDGEGGGEGGDGESDHD